MPLNSHPLVKKLEDKLLSEFEKVTAKIREEIPNVSVYIGSSSSGSDEFLRHVCSLSGILNDSLATETDLVDLCVNISDISTIPKIDACVCWGHPSGYIEAEFPDFVEGSLNNSLIISDKVLEDLYKDLPRLYDALFEALKRRKPADE